jgi:flagellar motility protein MotE (MotC chaperone)
MIAQKANLDQEKLSAVKEVLFEEPVAEEVVEEESASEEPTPMQELLTLLDRQTGKPAAQSIADTSRALDERAARISRGRREISDRQRQVRDAAARLAADRNDFLATKTGWENEVAADQARARDADFRKAIAFYESIPAKQAKEVLAELSTDQALQVLEAMDERMAAKVLREIGNDDAALARNLLERLRTGSDRLTASTN